ncbi:polysaccharide biosynthesis protein [Acetivibrio mesophilus]|uniref:Polysaccharide biosynthesis protein n=1 Tax=Acetivibrio mesophilus TaxID=2487273 RepID=A0A4Q0I1F7_9FIRM|nr:nucleoside-diphosphate sugar epimerase/dehydratase [Acetivibrio mesophilus]ODM27115.1 nucleoside-diphosphate sugar epimerase [Clostridium sp. Bc-iso-3]RXE58006.1 polysaccharide biosynthesis protein [Acetivibrio mesophilus]HHV30645.1 polysaccharide biosynthesis protein [Clostridium sp.]
MKQKIRANGLIAIDAILVNISLVIAYLLRFDLNYANIPERFTEHLLKLALIATISKLITFTWMKLYNSLWKYAGIYEVGMVVAASFISNSIMICYVFLSQTSVPRSIFLICILTDTALITGIRFAYRVFRRIIKGEMIRFTNSKRVLIAGAGDAGAIIVREMKSHPGLKSTPVGIVDDDTFKIGKKLNGVPVVGDTKDVSKIIEKLHIDEVIIAMPSASHKKINDIYTSCAQTDCKVKILPSVSQLIDESVVMQKIRDVNIEDLLGREPVNLDIEDVCAYLKGQVVMVTGGGGSIGSELCRQIAGFSPKRLIILDNYENNAYEIQNELLYRYPDLKLDTVIANIREKQRLESIFKRFKPDVVFHAAAHKHVPLMESNPTEAIKNNVFGTMNVAECSDKYGAKRFVLISTDKAVNPTNIMGATKRIAEMIIQSINKTSKTEFVAVRFGNVLGSNGSVIPLFKKQIEMGGPVTVTHPEITRFFMTIPEAVQLVLQAGAMAKGGEIFVLDMGEPVKIRDLARNLIKLSGFEPDVDIKIEYTGLRPGEKLYEELLLSEEGLKATKNNKIYIAKPVHIDLAMLRRELDCLKDIMVTNSEGISEYIKLIVPTYKKAENGN